MKQTTKKLLAGMYVLTALCCGPRVLAQTLVLHHPNGTTTDVELFAQPRIEFLDDRVLITSTVLNMEYAKTDVLRFTYKGSTTTTIGEVKRQADVTQRDGKLVFHGIKAADKVAVYTASGVRLPVNLECNGTDASLNLSLIPQGVYLLSVNGKTSKFTRP